MLPRCSRSLPPSVARSFSLSPRAVASTTRRICRASPRSIPPSAWWCALRLPHRIERVVSDVDLVWHLVARVQVNRRRRFATTILARSSLPVVAFRVASLCQQRAGARAHAHTRARRSSASCTRARRTPRAPIGRRPLTSRARGQRAQRARPIAGHLRRPMRPAYFRVDRAARRTCGRFCDLGCVPNRVISFEADFWFTCCNREPFQY